MGAARDFGKIAEGTFKPQSDEDWVLLDAAAQQIFRPARPINDDHLFAGRLEQIRDLLAVIYQSGSHAILYGERGVGKTSLANIVNQRVLGELGNIRVLKISCNPEDTFKTIWSNVLFDFEYDKVPVPDFLSRRSEPFIVQRVIESLPENHLHLIILDEFDRVVDRQTKIMVADTIKYFSDNPRRLTILVVGVGKSILELFGNHPSISRCCSQIQMPRMSPKELRAILGERLPKLSMQITESAASKIVQYAQGLPGYVHLLGLLSAQAAISRRSQLIHTNDLQKAVSEALRKADESTRNEYYKAIDSTKPDNRYKEVLLACALARKTPLGTFAAGDVRQPYSHIMKEYKDIPSFARHLNAFCNPNRGPALEKSGQPKSFRYKFVNPLLEPLVLMNGISDKLIDANYLTS